MKQQESWEGSRIIIHESRMDAGFYLWEIIINRNFDKKLSSDKSTTCVVCINLCPLQHQLLNSVSFNNKKISSILSSTLREGKGVTH